MLHCGRGGPSVLAKGGALNPPVSRAVGDEFADSRADPLSLAAMLEIDHPRKMAAATWAARELAPLGPGLDRDRWRRCAEFGIQRLSVPAEDGGSGSSMVESLLTFEGLGLGCGDNGFVFALSSQVFAMQSALRSAATPAQLERWLPPLLAGDAFGAFAMSEIDAGSDSSAIATTAVRRGEVDDPEARYVLNGTKSWITLGPVADTAVVFATTDPAKGRWGITAFVVDTAASGITTSPAIEKMGLESSPLGSISFDDCELSAKQRLGPEGAGAGVFTKAVEGERAFLFAAQLGASERVLNRSIERARTRKQFGSIIGSNQAVSHRIADMKLAHEMARLLVYKTAALHDLGRSVSMASALAKLQTSEMAVSTALDAVVLHGAEGYTTELGVERELRDAIGGLAYSGTSDIQRMVIARLLRVDAPIRARSVTTPQDPG